MAAVVHPVGVGRPRPLGPVPGERSGARPHLRLVEPSTRPSAAVFWRRRLVVLAAAIVLVWALVATAVAVQAAGRAPAADPAVPAGPAVPPAAGAVHVVQPGDTLWSIARAIQPTGDVRPLVDRLVAAHGPGPLAVGDRIVLPAG